MIDTTFYIVQIDMCLCACCYHETDICENECGCNTLKGYVVFRDDVKKLLCHACYDDELLRVKKNDTA